MEYTSQQQKILLLSSEPMSQAFQEANKVLTAELEQLQKHLRRLEEERLVAAQYIVGYKTSIPVVSLGITDDTAIQIAQLKQDRQKLISEHRARVAEVDAKLLSLQKQRLERKNIPTPTVNTSEYQTAVRKCVEVRNSSNSTKMKMADVKLQLNHWKRRMKMAQMQGKFLNDHKSKPLPAALLPLEDWTNGPPSA